MRKQLLVAAMSLTVFFAAGQMTAPTEWAGYEKVFGVHNDQRKFDFDAVLIASSTSSNVLWPGEQPRYTVQVVNQTDQPLKENAVIHIIRYGCRGIAGDIWKPEVFRIGNEPDIPVNIDLQARGFVNFPVSPVLPPAFGGYAFVLEIPGHGSRFITSVARTFRADDREMQFPKQSLDDIGPDFLARIGVHAIRMGIEYTPTTAIDYVEKMETLANKLKEYQKKHITVLMMFGAGTGPVPLGTPRSFLDEHGRFLNTKQDYAWLPESDADFQLFVKRLCTKFGWPKGPVTAVSLWNEPWEGISISGWQSDMLRYREIYRHMADGVLAARKDSANVLIGGGDSNSNAWDKLFPDGKMTFLPVFDYCSIHYQGMESPAIYPEWVNRQSPNGRVKIWDTESWVGNTDDRIGLVVAANRSAGYDRSMGIYGGYLHTGYAHDDEQPKTTVLTTDGVSQINKIPESWSAAAAVGAVQHLVGERSFRELLFTNGLPWVMCFDGYNDDADDGTIAVCGDLGEAFGYDNLLFREVLGERQLLGKEAIRENLNKPGLTGTERDSLTKQLYTRLPLTGGRMIVKADKIFRLYDFYGNLVKAVNGEFSIPLTFRSYFLRTDGSPHSVAKLLSAIRMSKIEGYEPVEIIARDMTRPVGRNATLSLRLTNILNRTVTGRLSVKLGDLQLAAPASLQLPAHTTRDIEIPVTGGTAAPDNAYALTVHFDAGMDGMAVHRENMHVNLISHRTIDVDGKLEDWQGVLPQTVKDEGGNNMTVTEAAWYPFKKFDQEAKGYANGYLAYDDNYFYFAAKAADNTPNPGTFRFATRPDDEFFYPDTSFKLNPETTLQSVISERSALSGDQTALSTPDGKGRLTHFMESAPVTRSYALDLSTPDSLRRLVSFYLPGTDTWKAEIEIDDVRTGERLLTRKIGNLWHGAYESFLISGKVRVIFRSAGWWYTVKLQGIFLDSAVQGASATSAVFTGEDLDTKGQWRGHFGSSGYFLPGTAAALPADVTVSVVSAEEKTMLVWPAGVRHFSYRKDPVLPDNSGLGESFDNVQIAFNVIPIGKDGLLANPPGTMPRYTGYKCTDYEYALNEVAPQYGGGTEIWKLLVPGMNRKHFFPRQPKSPGEGAMTNGKLVIAHSGNTRITECAIPWSEIPEVKNALDEGKTIKFSFRVNDDGSPGSCLELANGRSVSKKNARAFHPDWKTHWANEVEFGFEK